MPVISVRASSVRMPAAGAEMRKSAFRITYPAILSSLTVICLAMSGIVPSGQLGFAAVGSLFAVAAVLETSWVSGAAVYAVSAVLSLVLAGDKTAAFLYLLFFGYYPVLKLWADRSNRAILRWGIKFLVLNAAVTAALFLLDGIAVDLSAVNGSRLIAYLAANAVLVPYDMGISRLAQLYATKLSPKIKRGKS